MAQRRVAVFGIFDGVHEGHRNFFRQAKEKGDELVVIVGRDSSVLKLKNKKPTYAQTLRVSMVRREPLVDKTVLGDKTLSTYKVLKQLKPDVICLGYDQQQLGEDLAQWLKKKSLRIELFFLKPHKPHLFHNSKLLKNT